MNSITAIILKNRTGLTGVIARLEMEESPMN